MRLSRRFKYFFRIFIWGFLGIHIGILIFLNLPIVQEKLSSIASKELGKLLQTEVSVGHVDVGLLNRIIIEDILLEDRQGEEMLKVARLSAKYEILPLFEGRFSINSVQLFGFAFNLNRENPEAVPNYQFVLDAFAPKDTLKEETNLDLRINSVLIRRGKIKYDVLSEPETPGKFNASHIDVENLAATISLKALKKDSLNAAIKRLSFTEQSGFALKKFLFKVEANNKSLKISDFLFEFPSSSLSMDSLLVQYDSLSRIPLLADDLCYDGRIKASVSPSDFSAFLPALKNMSSLVDFSLSFKGKGNDLEIPEIILEDKNQIKLNAKTFISDLNGGKEMFVDGQVSDLNITSRGIDSWVGSLTGNVPPILKRLEYLRFKGGLKGHLSQLKINGSLLSAVGHVKADLLMSTDDANNRRYSGGVSCPAMNLGKLFGNEKEFGMADFNVELKGFNYIGNYPESYIKGVISSLEYSGYRYENILLDGIYKDGGFNGKLDLDDENGQIKIDGSFNTVQKVPAFNLKAAVKNFRPNKLNMTDKYVDSSISLKLNADFTGNSLDNIKGKISLDSLLLEAPEDNGAYLKNLTIRAGTFKGEKGLRVESPFLNANIHGNFSYKTIPSSVLHIAQRYIPSLLSLRKNMPEPHNNFQFEVQVENTDLFRKLLYIPLDIHMPAKLHGYFNDDDKKLLVEGSFPNLTYNGTRYESATLLCENLEEELKCQARTSMLMGSGAMLNLALDAKANQDKMKTVINWGNNTDVTYGGQLSAVTRFFKTDGKNPILQADIDVLPTQIILNDSVWNIRPSHIALDSGRVFIDNFLVERPNQYLRIDGKVADKETDSCLVNLKNIDVKYVLDIVRFDAVEFSGQATGVVNLKSILKDFTMNTHLNVHNFAVNSGLMGEADITGAWDHELGGVRLEAQIEEENLSATHVTGYVSPKLKGLDLMIDADSTSIALLNPYLEGIFSDLNGRVNGFVRLHGPFKALDFEGKVSAAIDAKVDVLNTYFQVRNDSVTLSSGDFAFNNVRVYDREGNTGLVNGHLWHNHLKNLTYRFDIQANHLLMYNTNDPGDLLFYGKVYGKGNVVLQGGNNSMMIDASVTTGRNTTFTYVTGLTTEATNNQFITFVDKTPKRVSDNVKTDIYHFTDAQKKEEDDGPPMDLYINMMIDATPDASMCVVMDPIAGDNITARGNGNFKVTYYNKGDFTIYGTYNIDNGMYKLSMQEVIRKDFALNSGSTVTFAGDPYLANLDVQAVHTVNSVSLSDLSPDASLNQSTVKVNCLMNLTGSLANPEIKFDLELPTVSEEDRELVRSATSTEEQMNTQIIYLLGIGKFYTYDYANNQGQSSNATSSLAFNTLSGQLNNMLSQWMDSENWNLGANLSTGEKGWTDVEAEAILSGRLLNNRLLINGNFGYRENVLANTNFIGDFEVVWLLTRNGDFRIRAYNQTNDRYFTKSTLTTQGVGFMYKKDFNKWEDLFQWFIKNRNKNKVEKEQVPEKVDSLPVPASRIKRNAE